MECLSSPTNDFLDPLARVGYGSPAPTTFSHRKNIRNGTIGGSPISATHSTLTSTSISENCPRKFNICGFLPLPSITASPVCTPTSTIHLSSPSLIIEEDRNSLLKDIEEYTTAPNTPSLSLRLIATPTWISTPPTPPPRVVRRSATTVGRPPSPLLPSASFPASTPPHAEPEHSYFMKRCASVPSMLPRQRASSDATVGLGQSRNDERSKRQSITFVNISPDALTKVDGTTKVEDAPSAQRSRPIFHIANEVNTDTDDASPRVSGGPERMNEDMSAEGSWSDNDSDDTWNLEKTRDDIRKYYALRELLTTEMGYLLDLRALVSVYLRILPTLVSRSPTTVSTFTRASSSFASNPWANSYSHLHVTALSSATTLADTSNNSNGLQIKEHNKGTPRYLFTDQEIELLTRNAEDILQLHEQFVRELRDEMSTIGFPMEVHESPLERHQADFSRKTNAAIRAVSTKFATEASRFNSYQMFCAGHPEALDLIRRTHSQYPLEWDAYEQRCSALITELELSNLGNTESSEHRQPSTPEEVDTALIIPDFKDRTRTMSLSSVDGAVRTLRSRASGFLPKDSSLAFPQEIRKDKSPPRLAFVDYMIKPVQRICKYPLVLDQLKPGKTVQTLLPLHLRSDVDVIVDSAAQAMRHVASSVDEARHRQDVAIQSALIISRITLNTPTNSSPTQSPFQPLTLEFLQSLGTCLLAGSLDVMHYPSAKPSGTSNINAKYFGAFLYLGGYLILVKVSKSKVYEPKHWFSLNDFDISDIEEDDAMLPCSFRLSTKEHRFELAAACQREKIVWLSSMREAVINPSIWANEPTPSIRFDGKGDLIPSFAEDVPFEANNTLPTIQSIPELISSHEYPELVESLLTASGMGDTKNGKSVKHDVSHRHDTEPPSRRSSTASVKAIFSPMNSDSETIVIRRSSAPARSRVDQGLQDVISQPCLTARLYASSREELLFQAPKVIRPGFVRSHSGLTMAGMAKSRLTRHESVRVLRRKSFIDGSENIPIKIPSTGQSQILVGKRYTKNLGITALSESNSKPAKQNLNASVTSPSPFPQNSAMPALIPASTSVSPIPRRAYPGTAPPSPKSEPKSPLKTSRSLVTNVKGFFYPRSSSPVSLSVPSSNQPSEMEPQVSRTTPATHESLKRWAKGSLHRRARSAPDVPEEATRSPTPSEVQVLAEPSIPVSRSSDTIFDSRIVRRLSTSKPIRRKSLLSSSAFRCSPESDITHRGAKHISLLQRLKA
ncbi:hypothetical protein BDZ94DRAFT_1321048 [Collybia nuda]|uniref:DH domain-containing protein n=1 Tax=Collybia nuda TaxID=64659 RepID=A0A9P6CFV3_9AGAR|nr:hypothetical protein BDZ94DRAFT_1321048 [Collybia nuda]